MKTKTYFAFRVDIFEEGEREREIFLRIFIFFLKSDPVHTGYPRRREGRSVESESRLSSIKTRFWHCGPPGGLRRVSVRCACGHGSAALRLPGGVHMSLGGLFWTTGPEPTIL
jgi:hypothetical protein